MVLHCFHLLVQTSCNSLLTIIYCMVKTMVVKSLANKDCRDFGEKLWQTEVHLSFCPICFYMQLIDSHAWSSAQLVQSRSLHRTCNHLVLQEKWGLCYMYRGHRLLVQSANLFSLCNCCTIMYIDDVMYCGCARTLCITFSN